MRAVALAALVALGCASSRPATVSDGTGVPLNLTNRMSEAVCFLFLSPPGQDRWGDDILGSATIDEGASRTVQVPRGLWDMRAESCSHELMGVVRAARITRATALVLQ